MHHEAADLNLEPYVQAAIEDRREAQNTLAARIAGQTIPPTPGAEAPSRAAVSKSLWA